MFSTKEKTTPKKGTMERNVIAKNTTIAGEINSDGDFRIDGTLEGNLKTNGRVIIGADGIINGNVNAANADIEGTFKGKLEVSNTLTVKGTATISGEVVIGKLSVEPGATFNATCAMKGAQKDTKQGNDKKSTSEKTA